MYSQTQDFIDLEAKSLSTRYGLKYEGVKNHLRKAFKHIKFSETIADIGFARQYLYYFRQALTNWPKRRAVNYYLAHSPDEILAYASACEYLSELNTPLLSKEELKEQTENMICFLEQHKRDIIAYGLPKVSFPGHPWFESHLSKTFPTECYASQPFLGKANKLFIRCADDDYKSFLANPMTREQSHMGHSGIKEVLRKSESAFYVADNPSGQDVIPIEPFRERFLNLKIEVLRILDGYLESEQAENLINTCIKAITLTLSAVDLSILAKTEGYNSGLRGVSAPASVSGGFFDLIEVIGHYDNELHSRMYARVKKRLGKLVIPIGFSQVLKVNSCFLIAGKRDARRLDSAITEFIMLTSYKRSRLGHLWDEVSHLLQSVYQDTKLDEGKKADIELFLALTKKFRESDPHWNYSKYLLFQGRTQRQEGSDQNNSVLQVSKSLSDDRIPREPNPEAILWIETNTNSAYLHGHKLDIEPMTYKLLLALANTPTGLVKDYAELTYEIWGENAEDKYFVKQLMNRKSELIRAVRAIEATHNLPFNTDLHLLQNISGKGYAFLLKPNDFDIGFRFKMPIQRGI